MTEETDVCICGHDPVDHLDGQPLGVCLANGCECMEFAADEEWMEAHR